MPNIHPCLWYDGKAEEAANFYCSLFPNSKIDTISYSTKEVAEAGGGEEGQVLTVHFSLDGKKFMGLNGGPIFQFTEAVSLMVFVETQEEFDHYWYGLTADGGEESMCGWLKDRYGLSWQIVPNALMRHLESDNEEERSRALAAMLEMQRIDIAAIEAAARGESQEDGGRHG